MSYFEGYNDALESCADVEKAALVKRICDLELQVDLQSRLRARSSAAMRDAEIRISILSRGVDELFAVKRSEAILVVAAKDLLADVCRRHPGEDLRCPLMISLDDAVKKSEARKA
jgi:hypothetical protein